MSTPRPHLHEICSVELVMETGSIRAPTLPSPALLPNVLSPLLEVWRTFSLYVDIFPTEVAERKLTMEEEEAKRIAEMGKPILGEHPKLEVIIEESYEFKVSVGYQETLEEEVQEKD